MSESISVCFSTKRSCEVNGAELGGMIPPLAHVGNLETWLHMASSLHGVQENN